MAALSPKPTQEPRVLPQYGFPDDVDFHTLIHDNRLLFRIYTPKERSPFVDDSDPFFVAARFNEKFAPSPVLSPGANFVNPYSASYDDIVRHMDWTTRISSPYISTSFSFMWSVWEALRRYHLGVKQDIQIAVIDAHAISDRALTAVHLLGSSTPGERHRDHLKWWKFSQDSQLVLVHGSIPGYAVLSSIPLLSILERLPTYFLHLNHQSTAKNPIARLSWDYASKRLNFRRFCQDMSNRFSDQPAEARLLDVTTGSVRLALAFLRPWFHQMVLDDFNEAIATLSNLAFNVAQWPAQSWAYGQLELNDIIKTMTLALAEELREKYGKQVNAEVVRLQQVVDVLEKTVDDYKAGVSARPTQEQWRSRHSKSASESFIDSQMEIYVSPPRRRRPSLPLTVTLPAKPLSRQYETPITPPASPRCSRSLDFLPSMHTSCLAPPSPMGTSSEPFSVMGSRSSSPIQELAPHDTSTTPSSSVLLPLLAVSPIATPSADEVTLSETTPVPQTPSSIIALTPLTSPSPSTSSSSLPLSEASDHSNTTSPSVTMISGSSASRTHSLGPSPGPVSPLSPISPSSSVLSLSNNSAWQYSAHAHPILHFPVSNPQFPVSSFLDASLDSEDETTTELPTLAEAASHIVAGFLIGTFITIFLLAPQRRILHLT